MAPIDTESSFSESGRFPNINFLYEALIASRFGLVGLLSTAVHIAIFWALLTITDITPILANTLAFLTAFNISFGAHYLWTFRSPGSPGRAIFRFFVIAISAFLANTLLLAFLIYKNYFPPVTSAIISASAVSVASFLASRLWGFKDNKEFHNDME